MVYRNLLKRNIGLIGAEKVCLDVKTFFCELNYHQTVYADQVSVDDLYGFRGCDVIIVGLQEFALPEDVQDDITVPVMTLSGLFEMIDELETFYIDKMFASRHIGIYGTDLNISKLLIANPNLKVDYILSEEKKEKYPGIQEILVKEIKNIDDLFVIIADEVDKNVKDVFQNMGLEFGKDFHFYNSRKPKHPTSFYLRKTIVDEPRYTIPCDYTTKALSIKAHGNIMACCSSVGLTLGNSLYTSIEEVLRGIQAQLVCLSVNNRTYSFCGEMCYMYREKKYCLDDLDKIKKNPRKNISLRQIPDFNVQLGYDRSCNLACPSCRNHRIIKPEDDTKMVEMMHDEVKRMCQSRPRNLRIGNGELFFSPYYKDIIFNYYNNDEIALISNGMLFNEENWQKLDKRYKKISLEISIDAVSPETYKKLRGGNLTILRKNMDFASILRKEGKLKRLSISFVIQVENFREMEEFVEYGKSIHADFIHFMKLNSWGHIPEDIFVTMDVYDKRNKYHNEFVKILRNPIFMDPGVHVDNIENFL